MNDDELMMEETDFTVENANAPEQEHYELVVPPEFAGERLDIVITRLIGDISRVRAQNFIKQGHTLVNGQVSLLPRFYMAEGDKIVIDTPAQVIPVRAEAENIPLDVLYKDDAFIVINKPADMVVHPGVGNHSGTVVNAILGMDEEMAGTDFPNPMRPGIVHRLDKDTTGCLCVARTPKTLWKLSRAFANRDVEKTYLAIVYGKPLPHAAVIKSNIGRNPGDRQKMMVLRDHDSNGKEAITSYRTLRQGVWEGITVSLLQVRLYTGRTHQIRVHMSHAGYPLIGDKLYNRGRSCPAQRQMLHAWQLAFPHPVTGEKMSFEAPLPADFRAIIDQLQPV